LEKKIYYLRACFFTVLLLGVFHLPKGAECAEQKINIDGASFRGKADAPVTIVEYGDFQCPYCRRSKKVLDELFKWRPDKIKFVYKNYPLTSHLYSYEAAEAWYAAKEKGKSWEMYDLLYSEPEDFERETLLKHAKKLGLDEKRFLEILENEVFADEIEKEKTSGEVNGVVSLPTIFINGKKMRGLQKLDALKAAVAKELGENIPELADKKMQELPRTMSTVGADINMRVGPGTHFAIVWHIAKVADVEAMERSGDWIKVKYQGFSGWVHGSLLKKGK